MSPADIIYQLFLSDTAPLSFAGQGGGELMLGQGGEIMSPQGSGGIDWKASVSFMPDAPDYFITVYDTVGKFDGRLMRGGKKIEHSGIQVRVRGLRSNEVWEKANAIAEAMDATGVTDVTFSSEVAYRLSNISRTSPVLPMGVEEIGEKRRFNLTINAILTYRQI